jgi:hypothetical protein
MEDTYNLKIISDGFGFSTRVFTPKGEELKGIVNISIDDITPGSKVAATFKVIGVALDIDVPIDRQ